MAHLLGSKTCIESLQSDVKDLHSTVTDIISRTGPLKFPSWKFPDKSSTDLDIEELLVRYHFSKDEEDNQVCHIVLFELVIDRLVLLMQGMGTFVDQLLSPFQPAASAQKGRNLSIGLNVKKCWNKMTQLNGLINQFKNEQKKLQTELEAMRQQESTRRQVQASLSFPSSSAAIQSSPVEMKESKSFLERSLVQSVFENISRDQSAKSCQTNETAFAPCEECAIIQKAFRQLGSNAIEICKKYKIPSAFEKLTESPSALQDVPVHPYLAGETTTASADGPTWLEGSELQRWCSEMKKDYSKIVHYMNQMEEQNGELQQKCTSLSSELEKIKSELNQQKKNAKKEKDNFQEKINKLEAQLAQLNEQTKSQITQLTSESKAKESNCALLLSELANEKAALKRSEYDRIQLAGLVEEKQAELKVMAKLNSELNDAQTSLDEVKDKLHQQNEELLKEKSKNKSMLKQDKTLQARQESLMKRVAELDQDCEQLREQIADVQDAKERLERKLDESVKRNSILENDRRGEETSMKKLLEENRSLKESLAKLNDSVASLEEEITQLRDREKLLVEYPDLNGPVNSDYAGTGDLLTDMQNQLHANSMRIELLQGQNSSLEKSIQKLVVNRDDRDVDRWVAAPTPKLKPQAAAPREDAKPVQLWKTHDVEPQQGDDDVPTVRSHRAATSNAPNAATGKPPLPSQTGTQEKKPVFEFCITPHPSLRANSASSRGRRPSSSKPVKTTNNP